jgi:hypothetical protein
MKHGIVVKKNLFIHAISAATVFPNPAYAMIAKKKVKIPRARSEWEERFALQLRLENIHHEREYRFDKTRKWRADFFIDTLEYGILVEIQGAIWNGGRHTRGKGYQADCERLNRATILGFKVLWGTPHMVRSGLLLDQVKQLL